MHTSASGATWLLTAYLLSAAIATPILGRVGDMVGKEKMHRRRPRRPLGRVRFSAPWPPRLPVMLVGRVIQGTGGAVFPLAFGIIRDEFPAERVAGAIGVMSAILGIGAGAGIVLAGPILVHLSYHWLFWIPLIMSATATVATFVFVPESPVRAPGRINWLGALLMSGWLVTGLVAVSEGPDLGLGATPPFIGLFAATAVLLVLWVVSENRSDSPMVDMKMMRIPAVWSTNLAALLFGFGMFAMFITVPQFVETPARAGYGFGASVTQSGLYLAALRRRHAPRRPADRPAVERRRLQAGPGGRLALRRLQLPPPGPGPQPSLDHLRRPGLLGIGIALGYASMANLIIEAVPAEQTGVATGMNTNIRNIGAALGSGDRHQPHREQPVARRLSQGARLRAGLRRLRLALVVAALAALTIPKRTAPSVVVARAHPALTAEAEVFVGAIGFGPEDLA